LGLVHDGASYPAPTRTRIDIQGRKLAPSVWFWFIDNNPDYRPIDTRQSAGRLAGEHFVKSAIYPQIGARIDIW
jgi:hypothetical protein